MIFRIQFIQISYLALVSLIPYQNEEHSFLYTLLMFVRFFILSLTDSKTIFLVSPNAHAAPVDIGTYIDPILLTDN